ncbi:hypothetical protein SEPCBS119000_003307 [Sporothrix epigloea]|uniref:Uncharacterized protein n=1 Tax=Sporothrix epigloea TaxID=1892477 RepID=A0ABP0DKY1_9PEZI
MERIRDLARGLVQRSYHAVQWTLGRDRTTQIGHWLATFYRDQPLLLGLVVTWLAFCAVPLAVFVVYATVWALVASGVFWAVFLFWAGLGLLFLIPALFVATGFSLVVFLWGAAVYFIGVRILAAVGYQAPFLLGGDEGNAALSTSDNTVDSHKPPDEPSEMSLGKPPSYALLPAHVARSIDMKPPADFGTPPLAPAGEAPISTK